MFIKQEVTDAYELQDMLWSGGLDTFKEIMEKNKEDQLIDLLEEVFCDEVPTNTEVNDYLWFDRDNVMEALGIAEKEEDEMWTLQSHDVDVLDEDEKVGKDIIAFLRSELNKPSLLDGKPIISYYTCKEDLEAPLERELTEYEVDALNEVGLW